MGIVPRTLTVQDISRRNDSCNEAKLYSAGLEQNMRERLEELTNSPSRLWENMW